MEKQGRVQSDLPATLIALLKKVLLIAIWFGSYFKALFIYGFKLIIKLHRTFGFEYAAFPKPTGMVRCYGHTGPVEEIGIRYSKLMEQIWSIKVYSFMPSVFIC